MGPFELMDLIGIDVNFAAASSVYEGFFQDPRFRPPSDPADDGGERAPGTQDGAGLLRLRRARGDGGGGGGRGRVDVGWIDG